MDTLQTQWSWLLQITKCIHVHLKENSAYSQVKAHIYLWFDLKKVYSLVCFYVTNNKPLFLSFSRRPMRPI